MERVLVVDDERSSAWLTAEILRRAGMEVEVAFSGSEALVRYRARAPDLMIVDYDMPDLDAVEVLAALRRDGLEDEIPVLIFTGARLAAGDQVIALQRGAVDYVMKGVDRHVLVARARNAMRRGRNLSRASAGRLTVDLSQGMARLDDRWIRLPQKPLMLLFRLASRPREVVSRTELLELVWAPEYRGLEHSVDQAVYVIRRALSEPAWIETVHRRGYRLIPQP